jgi:hypothetical protein
VSRDSSEGIATRYELDNPGIEAGDPDMFYTRPDSHWRPSRLLWNEYGSLSGVKRPRRGVNHSPHLPPRIKKRVELYLTLLPFWDFMASSKLNSTLMFEVYRLFSTSNITNTLTRNIKFAINTIYNKNHLFTSRH